MGSCIYDRPRQLEGRLVTKGSKVLYDEMSNKGEENQPATAK